MKIGVRIIAAVAAMPLLYVLSLGPVVMLSPTGYSKVYRFYVPIMALCKEFPSLVSPFTWYLSLGKGSPKE
jgi:hypothetical protein